MQFYSVTKNETMPFAGRWLELEITSLSEVSQKQKKVSCSLKYVENKKRDDLKIEGWTVRE